MSLTLEELAYEFDVPTYVVAATLNVPVALWADDKDVSVFDHTPVTARLALRIASAVDSDASGYYDATTGMPVSEEDVTISFDAYLDELHPPISVLDSHALYSRVAREHAPIDYRGARADYESESGNYVDECYLVTVIGSDDYESLEWFADEIDAKRAFESYVYDYGRMAECKGLDITLWSATGDQLSSHTV
ncbi:hypothetical protein [Microbacterium sp. YY-01]|uniref:hypothetical protein n=1 Tax=Microbacterium sp. YY-01 TaxID=3421634 RepID=UPI003D16CEE5